VRTNGYVAANGIDYYYEVHGDGEPLLLLHGGLGSIEMFEPDIPALAADRQVIAVEMQGHGRTSLGDRKISAVDMGDDMATIVRELGFGRVDAMGYSLGAGVVFRLAVQHPDLVRRLVLVSGSFSTDGFHREMRPIQAQMSSTVAEAMKGTPIYETYLRLAPNPDDFGRLLDRMGDFMREDWDWRDDVAGLTMPVMLVWADSDMFTTTHMAEFYNLLGGNVRDAGWQRENMSQNRLAIIPDRTHYDIGTAPELVTTVLPFLNGIRKS
jgi:pimeloyl-ACP methyl ester carboxylesterase